ncbi:MAG: metallophosphoesterase family protein [Bacteroidota bacterium]
MNTLKSRTMYRLQMPVFVVIAVMLLFVQNLQAQDIKLQFNRDKTFKIVQFTDTHFYIGGERSSGVLENIKVVMEAENPDLVVLTGDIVTGRGENWPTIKSWEVITNLLIDYKTPYAIAFGNHDSEAQTSREKIIEYLSKRPYCLMADDGGDKVKGVGNYMLPVYNKDGKAEKLIYCMDSGEYSPLEDKGVDGYDWIRRSQIDWFARTNQTWLEKNPDIQSLLFFHIPLPEYKQAFDAGEYRIGVRMEDECAPDINTGMFAEMVQQGNVLGTFVGHDHDNNYAAQLYNIALCYGYTSVGNSYNRLPMNGSRIILLEEGKRTFTTWLRRSDGRVLYKTEFPYSKEE